MPRAVLAIFLVVLVNMIAFGIITPILPLYAEHLLLTPPAIGSLIGIYSAMQLVFTPVLGRASDRFGRRSVLMLSLFGTAVGLFIIAEAKSASTLFLGRIIDGITGGNVSVAQAYIADISAPEKRSRYMGITAGAFGLGLAIGPFVGGAMSRISIKAPFLLAAGLAAAAVVLVWRTLPDPLRNERSWAHKTIKLTSFSPVIGTYFCLNASLAMVTTVFALFCEKRLGYGPTSVSFVFGFFGIVLALVQLFVVGTLLRLIADHRLALIGLSIMAISIAALTLASRLNVLLCICAGIALGDGLATPTLTGLASRIGDSNAQGRLLGYLQAGGALARLFGPIVAGLLLTLDSA